MFSYAKLAPPTHACERKRYKGDANTVRTTTVEGGVEVHFQMKSGSTALRWVSEEEPPQRSLTPLYCLAELLLAASLLLSYFLGKLQKFTAFSQCPQQQFWATCTTTALVKPNKEKSKDDRKHFSPALLPAWVKAEPELHEVEKERIESFYESHKHVTGRRFYISVQKMMVQRG